MSRLLDKNECAIALSWNVRRHPEFSGALTKQIASHQKRRLPPAVSDDDGGTSKTLRPGHCNPSAKLDRVVRQLSPVIHCLAFFGPVAFKLQCEPALPLFDFCKGNTFVTRTTPHDKQIDERVPVLSDGPVEQITTHRREGRRADQVSFSGSVLENGGSMAGEPNARSTSAPRGRGLLARGQAWMLKGISLWRI
jgi:hypothetical protein